MAPNSLAKTRVNFGISRPTKNPETSIPLDIRNQNIPQIFNANTIWSEKRKNKFIWISRILNFKEMIKKGWNFFLNFLFWIWGKKNFFEVAAIGWKFIMFFQKEDQILFRGAEIPVTECFWRRFNSTKGKWKK